MTHAKQLAPMSHRDSIDGEIAQFPMRAKIHSFWESFAPTATFFAIYLWVWIAALGVSRMLAPLAPAVNFLHSVQGTAAIDLLRNLDFLKLSWIIAAFLLGLCLYLFDRVVYILGYSYTAPCRVARELRVVLGP
jgi:hypothetical protein